MVSRVVKPLHMPCSAHTLPSHTPAGKLVPPEGGRLTSLGARTCLLNSVKFMSGLLAQASFQRAAEVLNARGAVRTGVRRAVRRAYMLDGCGGVRGEMGEE